MTDIYLYGALGRKFTHRIRMEVSSPAEAIRGLTANFPGFQKYLIEHSTPGYQIILGQSPIPGPEALRYPVGRSCIKIVPVVAGAAKSGTIGIIIGVIIVAATIASFNYELLPFELLALEGLTVAGQAVVTVGLIGASLAIGGIAQLLAGVPKAPGANDFEKPENRISDIFNGPVNTVGQGHPVPVGYGRLRVGSAVISAGIDTRDL